MLVRAVGELHAKCGWRWPCQPKLALLPPVGHAVTRGCSISVLWFLGCPLSLWCLVCCCVGWFDFCLSFGTKFSLLGLLVEKVVQNSPCMRRLRQIGRFWASRESFVPEVGVCDSCGESFVPDMWRGWVCVESFVPEGPGWRSSCASWRAIAAPWRRSWAARLGSPCPRRCPCW